MHYFNQLKLDEILFEFEDVNGFKIIEDSLDLIGFADKRDLQKYKFDRYIFFNGDNYENYCKEEIEIIELVNDFNYLGSISDDKSQLFVYEAQIDVDPYDFDYYASAIIKIIDKAFKTPFIIFLTNQQEVIVGTNPPEEINFMEKFLYTQALNWLDFREFIYWLFETLLFEIDCNEVHFSITEYILNESGLFAKNDDYSDSLSLDELKRYMKVFNLKFYNNYTKEQREVNPEFTRVKEFQKKYRFNAKELEFIKYSNESSSDYLQYIDENRESESSQLNIFDEIIEQSSDEIDEIINQYDDEDFKDPLNLL